MTGIVIVTTGWRYADPLVGVLIGIFLVVSSWGVLRDSTLVLLEATPRGMDAEVIGRAIAAQPGVVEVHDLHVWQITSGFPSLSAHVLVREGDDCHGIRRAIERDAARAVRDHAHDAAGRPRARRRAAHDHPGDAAMSAAEERTHRRVTRSVLLPLSEIELRVSRSSGPGGQHANTSETRVEAVFDVEASTALTANQKHRVVARAGPVLRAVAQDERSQLRNRELAIDRLVARLAEALRVERKRVPTKPSARRAREAPRGEEAAQRRRSGCAGSATVSELEPPSASARSCAARSASRTSTSPRPARRRTCCATATTRTAPSPWRSTRRRAAAGRAARWEDEPAATALLAAARAARRRARCPSSRSSRGSPWRRRSSARPGCRRS